MGNKGVLGYLIFFVPWLLATLFSADPLVSYLIAWCGSFFIFFVTLSGKIKPLPDDLPVAEQLMRPVFIIQIIFAGYMCITSIFYFLNVLGYEDFKKVSDHFLVDKSQLELTAECQRYYCLGHASFMAGILAFMRYPETQKYRTDTDKLANLLLTTAVIAFPVSILFLKVPGLSQFYFQLSSLSFIAGTLALAFAIPQKKIVNTLISLALYAFNFYLALTSGFKEPIIISVLVLGIFLYPSYQKLVLVIFVPLMLLLFMILPAYISAFRQTAWSEEGAESKEAAQEGINAALNAKDESNWDFLVYRLSEIDMFTRYVKSTPSQVDYYDFQLLEQSVIALVPRIFWPSKPNTEELIMERVYASGAVYRGSRVSAKPTFIVDAYLSKGTIGIIISLFIYGAAAQLISRKAEELFGGYTLGTALIFSGLFQIFWRGLSFEFIANTVVWSYVTMLLVHKIFKTYHIITED
jgi:hypothetical protein